MLTACRGPRNPTVFKFRTNELALSFDSCKLGICITETQELLIVCFSMREKVCAYVWSVCRCTYNNAKTTYANITLGVVPQVPPETGSLTGLISDLARLANQQAQSSGDPPLSLQCWD